MHKNEEKKRHRKGKIIRGLFFCVNIYEDLQYDSLAIVELLTAIEEEFGVDFTELDDFEDL